MKLNRKFKLPVIITVVAVVLGVLGVVVTMALIQKNIPDTPGMSQRAIVTTTTSALPSSPRVTATQPTISTAATTSVVTTTTTVPPVKAAPTAPKPSSLKLPEPNFASLRADPMTFFERVVVPDSETWEGLASDPDTEMVFADRQNCAAEPARCPIIRFVNADSPYATKKYTTDPLTWWKANSCTTGKPMQGAEGPASFPVAGVEARFYQQKCDKYDIAYLWLVPDKHLFVLAVPGEAGSLSPEIIQAALLNARWM